MKISIKQIYKSIAPCEFELPKFSIITGKNGSGKTHLLEAIGDVNNNEVRINNNPTKSIKYIPFGRLHPNVQESHNPASVSQHIKTAWNEYKSARQTYSGNAENNIEKLLEYIPDPNNKRFVKKTFEESRKSISEITEDNFRESYNPVFMSQNDFFSTEFALIFKEYHRRHTENEFNIFYQSQGTPPSKPTLTNKEFIDKYGSPPWDLVNQILKKINIPYEVNNPIGTRVESDFMFKLTDKERGFEISTNDLSTGEKTLMSLALAMYQTSNDIAKPDLLMIDEPDAGLHPSMSKLMVNVLKENFVKENNISIIISSHSPTTILAADGTSIYQLIRGNSIPIKTSTQEAVEILSSDFPFLKVSTEKRRQVFVESQYDVYYYELLTNIFRRLRDIPSEPIFIPARTSPGSNSSDVIGIVQKLSDNGNEQVYGIVDWDTKNQSKGKILVLGENERYAIENYLLDPLLMGILLIREGIVPTSYFGELAPQTYSELINLTIDEAKKIVNKVLVELDLYTGNTVDYELANGWTLEITKEFNNHQGHELEELYKKKYPPLKSFHQEDALKKSVINKVINDHPSLSPKRLLEVIMKII